MILAIVQARMNSSRLPGKVLKKIGNLTVLDLLLSRLKMSKFVNKIVVATTTNSKDDILCQHLKGSEYFCFRGDENNVLKRYQDVLNLIPAETTVRITGDCPLIDAQVVDEVISIYEEKQVDYASNVQPPTYPDGINIEVIKSATLKELSKRQLNKEEKEHVTLHIRKSSQYEKANLFYRRDLSKVRLTLDEAIDFDVISNIFEYFSPRIDFTLAEIIKLYDKSPYIFKRNEHLLRNGGVLI